MYSPTMTEVFLLSLVLLLIGGANSFTHHNLVTQKVRVTSINPAANNNYIDIVHSPPRMKHIHARKNANRQYGNKNQQSRSQVHSSKKNNNLPKKRVPHNKRTAIRWVIQGVERSLAEEDDGNNNGEGGKSYKRRIDASLVDALYLMANAYSQTDVLDAEKRLRVLTKNPSEFPPEVTERVIKATAMAGLSSLSSSLLQSFMSTNIDEVPSSMAYTAVLNALRKNGRIDQMEGLLAELASACRRVHHNTGKKACVDIVAFNTYVAALCDACINELPFSASAAISGNNTATEEDNELMGSFNFTSLTNHSSTAKSSSEKYLYKALNLLRGDISRTRFALEKDPDGYSYNSVLNAAAKCSEKYAEKSPSSSSSDRNNNGEHFATSVMISCLRGMKERKIRPDILTYNARIRAALAGDEGEEAAMRLIDQLLADEHCKPDRYTVNFMLRPFVHAGRKEGVWSILRDFYNSNVDGGGKREGSMVSSAFEAFLNTIVRTGEVDFAREVFEHFFLPPKKNQRLRMSQMVHVINKEDREQQEDYVSLVYPRASMERQRSSRPPPRTRHFNILLGGYAKAYQSALSRQGKKSHSTLTVQNNGDGAAAKDLEIVSHSNVTMPDIQQAYELLEAMLNLGIPLDAFSVTSLMALPHSSPENITSLLERIEPEMMVELNQAAYRSVITAYGKAGDASSACWMFEEMTELCLNGGRSVESWNSVLGALAKCVNGKEKNTIDVLNSSAAKARRRKLQSRAIGTQSETEHDFVSLVDGKTCFDASMSVLEAMRSGMNMATGFTAPKPNSQTYCLIASALSASETSSQLNKSAKLALDLFRNATKEGVSADGRFLNAVLRCFGDDIDGALAAWKSVIGPSAANYEKVINKGGSNVIAAYNGLMHVCGRAVRPDIATRIAYAMNKAGVEPTEVTLNSYLAGKRIALEGNDDGKNLGLRNQYETLLSVECTKYNSKDKRRVGDRKIRIILS